MTARAARLVEAGLVVAVAFLAVGVRVPTLDQPLLEAHGFRQTQTAYTSLLFHEQGISLLHPLLPVLGPPFEVPFEFPLFQALASLVMDAGVSPDLAMRSTALACFLLSGVLLWGFVRRYAGRLAGFATFVVFLFSPFSMLWSRASLIEYLAVAAGVGWAWAAIEWRRARRPALGVVAVVAGCLACLVKVTTGFAFLIPILAYRAPQEAPGAGSWLRARVDPPLLAILGAPLLATVLWTRHADGIKEANPFTAWTTSEELSEWNFGTVSQRLDWTNWELLDRVASTQLGGIGFVALAVLGLWRTPNRALWIGWALVAVAQVGVFFNLHVVHDYYQASLSPIVATLLGLGIASFARWLQDLERPGHCAAGAMVAALLVFGVVLGQRVGAVMGLGILGMALWMGRGERSKPWVASVIAVTLAFGWVVVAQRSDPVPRQLAGAHIGPDNPLLRLARQLSIEARPHEYVVADGFDWSPELFYYARRRGTMLGPKSLTAQGIATLPASHKVFVSRDPHAGDLWALQLWPWYAPRGNGIYRVGLTRNELGRQKAIATLDGELIASVFDRAARAPERLELRCDGRAKRLPAHDATLWVRLGRAPDTARVWLGDETSPLPVKGAIVVAPSGRSRQETVLGCLGTDALAMDVIRAGD